MKTQQEYEEILRPLLSKKRLHHSICVADAAVRLAKRWGADENKAYTAGMLHDIMKDTPPEKQLKYMQEFGIILSDIQKKTPKVWHQMCGAGYLEHRLRLNDPEILDAVRYHTTGRAGMSLLEKVIFTADYISDDRDYDGVEELREAAFRSLEEAMLIGLSFTVEDLASQKLPIAADTFMAYNECTLQTNGSKK